MSNVSKVLKNGENPSITKMIKVLGVYLFLIFLYNNNEVKKFCCCFHSFTPESLKIILINFY